MRVLVTGGRSFSDAECIAAMLYRAKGKAVRLGERLVVVHGACGVSRGESFNDARGMVAARLTGADGMAHRWALWVGHFAVDGVDVEPHPADWTTYRKAAGPRRNAEMVATRPEACLAFPGGSGTADCTRRAAAAGVRIGRPIRDPTGWHFHGWRIEWLTIGEVPRG